MQRSSSRAEPADYLNVSRHSCARCGGSLIRTPRRPIDYFWNIFVSVHRFRCNRFSCQWTGNRRGDSTAESSGTVTPRSYQMKNRSLLQMPAIFLRLSVLVGIGLALFLTGCASQKFETKTQQSVPTTQVLAINLRSEDLRTGGIAFITPSSVTGQEEDKQALALAFNEVLLNLRPDLHIVPLPETLSAVNRMGLTREYRQMFEDYRLTGIFDRETLQKVAAVTKTRYLAQLKLGAFRQESKGRFGMLGLRVLETKTSTIRLFLQIWDSTDGSVAWEGAQESTVSHESLAEEYVSMKSIVQESARDLVAHLP